ncbi:DNA-directed RNA polymerase sigma 28 domain protein, partial [Chlamydia psittaci 06-1683]
HKIRRTFLRFGNFIGRLKKSSIEIL